MRVEPEISLMKFRAAAVCAAVSTSPCCASCALRGARGRSRFDSHALRRDLLVHFNATKQRGGGLVRVVAGRAHGPYFNRGAITPADVDRPGVVDDLQPPALGDRVGAGPFVSSLAVHEIDGHAAFVADPHVAGGGNNDGDRKNGNPTHWSCSNR